jgi:hypothetical protein
MLTMVASLGLTVLVICIRPAATEPAEFQKPLPDGQKTITLIGHEGERLDIGKATFSKDGDAAAFEIALDSPAFTDEFLSMRPFPCVTGAKETWCHLAYPYDLKKRIRAEDLTDLEYALLFLFKAPTGYGIDPWNGLYFRMAITDDGVLIGALHDVNLDPLGIPPEDRAARLIAPSDLTLSDPASHRFSRIEIR